MAKTKMTPAELKADLEAVKAAAEPAKPEAPPAPKKASTQRLVSLVPPVAFPGLDLPDGKGGSVTITTAPRLVSVATANALLAAARRPGNEFGLTEANIRIEEE